jgi:ABC-2 type transport system ATP-binding protein
VNPAVAIENVHKHYGTLHALDGVDFSIQPGEFFGLLGPNGAGKSTLINIMAGLVRATRGSISVMGHDVVRDYRKSRMALGVVPQELVYDPFFTVREVLRLQSGYFGCGAKNLAWIDELLETLDLSHKADANLHDLSGGMKRRVLIAQALVHRPQVVVLDEPTAGVDVELRKALWKFTRHLHQRGHTIVLTTHYLEEAESLCGRIAILHRGGLRALDDKNALLSRHPYRFLTLKVSDPAVQLPEAVARLVVECQGNQLTLRMHKVTDQIGSILDTLRALGVHILDLTTRDPGLEDVFLELTAPEQAGGQ